MSMTLGFFLELVRSQLFITPPPPTTSFSGQTIIVTGSNVGLGLEAARYFVRLDASKVILAVRTTSKGEAARRDIEESTGRKGVVDVWPLDLSSYESVQEFTKRAVGLERLDAIVENAGIATYDFRMAEDNESTITTNVVSTFLLAIGLLPKLRETAARFNTVPHLVIVSSEVHFLSPFPQKNAPNIFDALNNEKTAVMEDRYQVSKLLEVFIVRELGARTTSFSSDRDQPPIDDPKGVKTRAPSIKKNTPPVIINCLTPGLCHSELVREITGFQKWAVKLMKLLLARTTEIGSRTLVAGAEAGDESHGMFMAHSATATPAPLVLSEEGQKLQKRVWAELAQKLEKIQPGIMRNV